jgi:hypothetical protein
MTYWLSEGWLPYAEKPSERRDISRQKSEQCNTTPRGSHKHRTEKERHKQPVTAFSQELSAVSFPKREGGADARYKKEQVHEPIVHEDRKHSKYKRTGTDWRGASQKNIAHRRIVHKHRSHACEADGCVERSQGQNNQKPEPIEKGESFTA